LRKNEQARCLLEDMDEHGLLSGPVYEAPEDEESQLEELGVECPPQVDVTRLKHVAPIAHRRAAEEIANREVCRDFEKYEPLFEAVKVDLGVGA